MPFLSESAKERERRGEGASLPICCGQRERGVGWGGTEALPRREFELERMRFAFDSVARLDGASLSLSLSLPTMEMPNGVITHHNRPPAHRATDRPTDTDESGDYTMCAAYLLACVFACLLLCSREAARAGRGCAERGRGTCLAYITYPSFPPSLPPSRAQLSVRSVRFDLPNLDCARHDERTND